MKIWLIISKDYFRRFQLLLNVRILHSAFQAGSQHIALTVSISYFDAYGYGHIALRAQED